HLRIAPIAAEEPVEQVQRGSAAGDLERVDVRLDEEARLLEIRPRLEVCDRRQPDVPALVRLPDALELEELGALLNPALDDLGQLVVPVEPVEGNLRHRRSLRRELGDERLGIERVEADARSDLLAGRLRALTEEVAQPVPGLRRAPPVASDLLRQVPA